MLKALRVRRLRHDDGGSIAVMAAVIIPVILLVIALALASLVWGTSETEAQRASDQAALQAAASTELVPNVGLSTAPAFPTINTIIPSSVSATLSATVAGFSAVLSTTASQHATNCTTVGNVYTAVTPFTNLVNVLTSAALGITSTATLNSALSSISAVNPSLANALANPSTAACTTFTVVPAVVASARSNACDVASAQMAQNRAPWSNNFFGGTSGSVPDCDTNQRVSVSMTEDENSLLDLGGTGYTTPLLAGSQLGGTSGSVTAASVFNTVQSALAAYGVRLRTTLPNSLCPKVSVKIDQPVKGPLFEKVSVPNGRSTAQRLIKNAVIVPVFNGVSIISPNATVSGTVTPGVDLDATVLGPLQTSLLTALDAVDTAINQALAATNTVVSSVSGAQVGQLNLLQCLRNTVADLFNPPTGSGSSPTSSQLTQALTQNLTDAYNSGDPVNIIQVGVDNCAGASTALDLYITGCVAPALGTLTSTTTGLYDVPFLDVTPAIITSVSGGNFQAVPVAATQASGAFRAVLVRGSTDDRFLP